MIAWMISKSLKISSIYVSFLIIIILASISGTFVRGADEYVYYGAVSWDTSSALVGVVGIEDGTDVQVYTLESHALISTTTLNSMNKFFFTLSKGTDFKIVSNHLVYVMIISEGRIPGIEDKNGSVLTGFHTSVDGNFVGKEFIFLASQGLTGTPYRVHALEDAQITVYKEDGSAQTSFSLKANEYKDLSFMAYQAYKLTSTGSLMLESGGRRLEDDAWTRRSYFIPAAEGGFVGKHFYSSSTTSWDNFDEFRILSSENAKVSVWDVKFKQKLEDLEVKGGEGISLKPKINDIMIESDKPITFMYVHNMTRWSNPPPLLYSMRAAVTYMSVKPNEETLFFLPMEGTVKTYIFSNEDTTVKVDDVTTQITGDTYFLLTVPGGHKILSNKNIILQMVHETFIRALDIENSGVTIPCIQTVNTAPNVKLIPLVSEGFPMTYIVIGVVVAIAVAVVGFLAMRRRPNR